MTRIKIVPNATPNADGEWIECPVEFPVTTRWRVMASAVEQCVPPGHHVVAVEPGSLNAEPVKHDVLQFPPPKRRLPE